MVAHIVLGPYSMTIRRLQVPILMSALSVMKACKMRSLAIITIFTAFNMACGDNESSQGVDGGADISCSPSEVFEATCLFDEAGAGAWTQSTYCEPAFTCVGGSWVCSPGGEQTSARTCGQACVAFAENRSDCSCSDVLDGDPGYWASLECD